MGAMSEWAGPYLAVEGAPFPVIGAEVHNSSSSTHRAIIDSFTRVRLLGANTVLAPVAWDAFEPVEGQFDTSLVDSMIEVAGDLGLRLIPLWFGSWKNAASTYVPDWIKRDPVRFPRTQRAGGRAIEHLTPFGRASQDADARAFAALLHRIAEVDANGIVIAVQVENEIGLLGDSRDRSTLAEDAFAQPVPAGVLTAVASDEAMPVHADWVARGRRTVGSWAELFGVGDRADELFMAAGFAAYTQAVASAGKAHLNVPLYVNAWLDAESPLDGPVAVSGGKRPGEYPSGGPVLSVTAVWETLAPALDFVAPDMYVDDADPVFAGYRKRRGRLFVPELRADESGIGQMFRALGAHRALGVSPFGVDALEPDAPESSQLVDAFRLLRAAAAVIRQHPATAIHGFHLDASTPSARIPVGDVQIEIQTQDAYGHTPPRYPAYGVAIEDGEGGLFLIGRGFWISLAAPDGREASFLSVVQHELDGDGLTPVLRLNGDQTASGTLVPFPFPDTGLLPGRVIPRRLPDSGIARIAVYVC